MLPEEGIMDATKIATSVKDLGAKASKSNFAAGAQFAGGVIIVSAAISAAGGLIEKGLGKYQSRKKGKKRK